MKNALQKSGKIAISGSFGKHYDGICETIRIFTSMGIQVLSPKVSEPINPDEDFVLLKSDNTSDPKVLESRHLDAILHADALYIYNPSGYIGTSVNLEFGFALANRIPIYTKEKSNENIINFFCTVESDLEKIAQYIKNDICPSMPTINSSLNDMQDYIRQITHIRGFDDETPSEIILLLIEEIAELAHTIRKYLGLKTDSSGTHLYSNINHELADIFIYLLHLSNACNVSLSDAFIGKEEINKSSTWTTK